MIGQTISHYKITAKLGEGGMGVVYKAEDTSLGRTVALKFLAAHLTRDEGARKRFEREARAAASLDHPNVCTIHEIGEANGRTFLAMVFIEGQSLEDAIAQGPLPIPRALDIAQQIGRALQAAHEKGIVHRDIKPANVMIDGHGHVTVMDFGLALLATGSRLTQHEARLGTVAYMSPEQAQGSEVDHRTDIWALGCVCYEMVCGQRPFQGQYDQALIYEIVQQEQAPLTGMRTGVPRELEWIVDKCLAKDFRERYQSAAEILVDVWTQQKKLQSGKSSVRKSSSSRTLRAPFSSSPRRRTVVGFGICGLLVLLAAAFFIGTRFAEDTPVIPTYKRLTFRRGTITSARFAPDGNTIIYSAAWEGGRRELYSTRPESSESRSLNIQDVDILAISKTGEMALAQRPSHFLGASFESPTSSYSTTLLQASLAGGAPRAVLDDVLLADWMPDGELSVARTIDGRISIESPVGNVLYDTPDQVGSFRISPMDGRIALSARSRGFAGSWRIVTIGQAGEKAVLTPGSASGDNLFLAWPHDSQSLWYEAGFVGGQTITALSPSGTERTIQRVPAYLRLLDVSRDGRALVSRVNWRTGINCLAPGETTERDLSWFDASEVDSISPDGSTILLTEFGEGGGIEQWGVYMRKTNGGPAVRLGDGQAFALSRDGSMALTMRLGAHPEIVLLPTGAGEPVRIRNDSIRNYLTMDWMPDGRRIVFAGSAQGEGIRCYIQDVEGGEPMPITPEGYQFGLGTSTVSPDGEWIAAEADGPPALFPTSGGEARPISGAESDDNFVAWSADGRFVFVSPETRFPRAVYRVELSTGRRSLWKSLAPADPVGIFEIYAVQISADEESYCYSYARNISDLYLVEGLR